MCVCAFGVHCTVALEGAAAADDATPGRLWVWEVREPKKHLSDKASRKIADLQRKRRKEVRECVL